MSNDICLKTSADAVAKLESVLKKINDDSGRSKSLFGADYSDAIETLAECVRSHMDILLAYKDLLVTISERIADHSNSMEENEVAIADLKSAVDKLTKKKKRRKTKQKTNEQ